MSDENEREHPRQTDPPQDGPDAGGSSQGEPGSSGGSAATERRSHRPGDPADTNERADRRATVVGPEGEPAGPADEEES